MSIDIPLRLFHVHQFHTEAYVRKWITKVRLKPGLHYGVCAVQQPDTLREQIRTVVLTSLNAGGFGAGLNTPLPNIFDCGYTPWMPQHIAETLYQYGINPLRRMFGIGMPPVVFGNRFIDVGGKIRSIRECMKDKEFSLSRALGIENTFDKSPLEEVLDS